MKIHKTKIKNLIVFEPSVFKDKRGYFLESFNKKIFNKHINDISFLQDNESKSKYGVLRGLHYQTPPFAQSKLVRVNDGCILDVVVDLRKKSKTFGEHFSIQLSSSNNYQLFVPRGFAHGFVVLSDSAIVNYKVDNYYSNKNETGIIWNDPFINIDWKIPEEHIIISDKDLNLSKFNEINSPF